MKTKLPCLVGIALGFLSLHPSLRAEDKPLIDLSLGSALVGDPAPTAPFDPTTVNHSIESKNVTDANKIEVVRNPDGFPTEGLRFIKESSEPRSPRAIFVSRPGLVTTGKVRITWDSQIDSFAASEKFPGFEALMTLVLMDSVGTPCFNLYYLVDESRSGGNFGYGAKRVGTWKMGAKQQFEVVLDLDAGTALAKVDGVPLAEEQKVTFNGGLRVVQMGDGTGFAYYGSKFTGTLANFKMGTF